MTWTNTAWKFRIDKTKPMVPSLKYTLKTLNRHHGRAADSTFEYFFANQLQVALLRTIKVVSGDAYRITQSSRFRCRDFRQVF